MKDNSVKLSKQIPWQSTNPSLFGYVQAIGPNFLELGELAELKALLGESFLITAGYKESSQYQFKGSLLFSGGSYVLQINDEQKLSLDALLGQVRKAQHIAICRDQDVESSDRYSGFERFDFCPDALPELDYSDINSQSSFLGRSFSYPIFITGMTGGVEQGADINKNLALAAQALNIPMGIGSQRIALEDPKLARIFRVKQHAPELFLLGNIGGAQLTGKDALDLCKRVVEMIDADALAIHLNAAQEMVQSEGNREFKGIADNIAAICQHLSVPVVVKEVGAGLSAKTLQRLINLGVKAFDCAGRGGTSWTWVEALRSKDETTRRLGATFRNWGIPTAHSLIEIRKDFKDIDLIATGGIRNGLEVAKAVALGANMVGIGLPLFKKALISVEETEKELFILTRELKTAMLLTGSRQIKDLAMSLVPRYGS